MQRTARRVYLYSEDVTSLETARGFDLGKGNLVRRPRHVLTVGAGGMEQRAVTIAVVPD